MIEKIKSLAREFSQDVISIRRHLHQFPELSFEEHKTSAFIQNELTKMGIPFKTGYVKTGIVAHIEGKNPSSKVVALRADMDALPIKEENDVPYCSKNVGVMHACGHDVHTASLLGAARILHKLRDEFEGTVKLVFQPGEELLPGGASLMIKEKALEDPVPVNIVGQHVYPQLEAGKVGFRPGMYMASTDELHVTVNGKGGHAALPHMNIDPVLIASHIIVALQQVVSRNVKPGIPAVVSFGRVEANGATNVIPDQVHMQGTFRAMDEELRFAMHEKMASIANGIAEGMGGSCDFDIRVGYPFLVNDEELTKLSQESAVAYLGHENVVDLDIRMTAEDFAYYTQIMPGCFYRLGVKPSKLSHGGLHTSTFDIDESALELGMGLMAFMTIQNLNN